MGRRYSREKLERLMKEENKKFRLKRDVIKWSKKQEQVQKRCNSCRYHSTSCPKSDEMVACLSEDCLDSGKRCSRVDDELFDRIRNWRKVKRTHFDEIAKKLPKPPPRPKIRGELPVESTTNLLTPLYKSLKDEEEEEEEEEEESASDDDSGSQSEEASVHTETDDDDDGDDVECYTKPPSKRKRHQDSEDDSEFEGKPLSKKDLQATVRSLRRKLKEKAKQSADELQALQIKNERLSDEVSRQVRRKYLARMTRLNANMAEKERENAASKDLDRQSIQKWEKEAKATSAALDTLRREHAKLQEMYAHDKNETERGSTTSRQVSRAPQDETTMEQDVPMPAPTDIHSELQEEIRALKENQEVGAITEAGVKPALHWTEETSALKEADLIREINAIRETSIATETKLRQEIQTKQEENVVREAELRREILALTLRQESSDVTEAGRRQEICELNARHEASTAATETELQSLRDGLESANVAERNLRNELEKTKEDQKRQSKDEHYELSAVLQSLRRGVPRSDLAGIVQMQIPIIERLADSRIQLNLPDMDTSD